MSGPQQGPARPYYFYNDKSEPCRKLSSFIKQYPEIANVITWVLIDPPRNVPANLPKGLTSVPTILFNDRLFKGEEAFGLIQGQVKILEEKRAQDVRARQGQVSGGPGGLGGPSGYQQQVSGYQQGQFEQQQRLMAQGSGGNGIAGAMSNPLGPGSGPGEVQCYEDGSCETIGADFNLMTETGATFTSYTDVPASIPGSYTALSEFGSSVGGPVVGQTSVKMTQKQQEHDQAVQRMQQGRDQFDQSINRPHLGPGSQGLGSQNGLGSQGLGQGQQFR